MIKQDSAGRVMEEHRCMSTRNDSNNDLNEKSFLFRISMGAIFSIAAVLMLWTGIDDYTTQLKQVDWPITEATVLYVEEKIEGHNLPGKGGTHTSYDIYYQYVVDGQMYDGNFEQAAEAKIGETIKIKYDPNDPGYSTGTLKPSLAGVVIGIVMGVAAIIAFVLANVSRKRQKRNND